MPLLALPSYSHDKLCCHYTDQAYLCLAPRRLAWNNPRFSLEIVTQQQLKEDSMARDSLAAAISSSAGGSSKTSPVFVGIAISNPDVAAFLGQVTAKLPTALFWDSLGDLTKSSRVDGYAPGTAGPLAQLLAQHVGFSVEARAAKVLNTIDSLWGRHTSGEPTRSSEKCGGRAFIGSSMPWWCCCIDKLVGKTLDDEALLMIEEPRLLLCAVLKAIRSWWQQVHWC